MRSVSPQQQLDLFYSMPGDIAARDAQDLMSWPFFSLAKSRRSAPIDFAMGATWISVEAVAEHGMATIWDADILIWAASQLVEARDAGRPTSRHIAARPHEILTFIGRGTGKDHYERLRAALDRLQSTTVATSIRQQHQRRRHRFSWINEWRETLDDRGRAVARDGRKGGRDCRHAHLGRLGAGAPRHAAGAPDRTRFRRLTRGASALRPAHQTIHGSRHHS